MKKSVLALAIATVLAAPLAAQADTILYGSARVSVDYNEETVNDEKITGWDVVNNSSRLGVLGTEDLGGGLSAVYQYEFGVDVTEGTSGFESNRPKFVGLKGGFGTLTLGTQETPYYHVAGITDIFNTGKSFVYPVWLGGGLSLSGDRSDAPADLIRLSNSVYYSTPDFNGFSGEAMLVMDGPSGDVVSDGVDIWNLAAKYANGPFFAGLSYIKLEGQDNIPLGSGFTADFDVSNWVLGLGYNSGPFGVGFIYEQGDLYFLNILGRKIRDPQGNPLFSGDDASNWYLTGEYRFGNHVVRGAYGQLDTGIDADETIDNYLLGYQYNFTKRTSFWVEYIGREAEIYNVSGDSTSGTFLGDQNAFSVGTRVDF